MPCAPRVGARAPDRARELTHSRSRIEPAAAAEEAVRRRKPGRSSASSPLCCAPVCLSPGLRACGAGTVPNRSYLTACPADIDGPRPAPEHREATESERQQRVGYGEAEIRTHEAALQRGNERSRRPRQDDVDGGADEGVGGEGLDDDVCVV